jgi:SLOG cluster4 family
VNACVCQKGAVVVGIFRGCYDDEARRIEAHLPRGLRVGVLGSTDFWHADSERTCAEIGRLLAAIPKLLLLTGGVEGIGEAIGRSFFDARRNAGQEARVYHLLPEGEPIWDYGDTLFAGADMTERREILGRLSRLFVMVEGGPGAGHEADVAAAQGAVVIPVGRSGGYSATLYDRISRPPAIDAATWAVFGARESTPEKTAEALVRAVQLSLNTKG